MIADHRLPARYDVVALDLPVLEPHHHTHNSTGGDQTLNSGKNITGVLLKADNNTTGFELLVETESEKLVMIPYGAISAISFDQPPAVKEEEL